jgi:nitroreductase
VTEPDAVWTAIAHKRAIRRFAERPLDPHHLQRIVDAGRHAGSSKNTQPWDFVVVEDRETLRQLGRVGPYAGHLAGAAAGVALVTPDPATARAPLSVYWDLGQAAENMMLVAWELGIGSVPATVYEPQLAKRILGYPDDRHCEFLLSFGYPARAEDLTRPPKAGGRRSLDDIVHRERW